MTIPTDTLQLDLDALAERLRGEANFILGDAAAWGVDTYGDQPRTVRLLLEAADAIDLARRAAIPSEQGEAVAWVFELARALQQQTGEWMHFGPPQLSFTKPNVPDGSIRNLHALGYTHPAPAAGVKVKGLEWHGEPDWCFSDTIADHYSISKRPNIEGPAYELRMDGRDRSSFAFYDTPAQARDAAQSDYEARILSALDQGEPK